MDIEWSITAPILGLTVPPIETSTPASIGGLDDPANEGMDPLEEQLKGTEQLVAETLCRLSVTRGSGLIFMGRPTPTSTLEDEANPGLDTRYPINKPFLELEKELKQLERGTEEILDRGLTEAQRLRCQVLLHEVREAGLTLLSKRREEFRRQQAVQRVHAESSVTYVMTDSHFSLFRGHQSATVLAACLLVAVFSLIHHGTRIDCQYWLAGMQSLLTVALAEHIQDFDPAHTPTLPKTLQTALTKFNIEPTITSYVCCPSCRALYLPDTDGSFPPTCGWKDFDDDEPCGQALSLGVQTLSGRVISKPLSMYDHQVVYNWWGRMMCRPGIEKAADNYPNQLQYQENASDIWNARRIRQIRFKDGERCIKTSTPSIGRYVFSFGVDWFGAHGGSSSKAHSIGAVYLICQNLPPSIRFREDNICLVGLIPGPSKPHDDQLNHFLRPLVDDFKAFWEGIYYSRTYAYPEGRLVYGVLGPVIADLDACRAVGGFAPHSHNYFCSYCRIERREIAEIRPDRWEALKRTQEDHRKFADAWKDASSPVERKALYKKHATFWTPLMELSYWDPTKDLVLDPMHNLFLGVAHTHCEKIWLMNAEVPGGDGSGWLLKAAPSKVDMLVARMILNNSNGGPQRMKRTPKSVLQALCVELNLGGNLRPDSSKAEMIECLLTWKASNTSQNTRNELLEDIQGLQSVPRSEWESLERDRLLGICLELLDDEDQDAVNEIQSMNPQKLASWLKLRIPDTPALSITDLQDEEHLHSTKRESWPNLPKETLVRLANRYWVEGDPPLRPAGASSTSSDWGRKRLASFLREKIPDDQSNEFPDRVNRRLKSKRTVLGSTLLNHVWKNIENTVLPTWINPLPSRIGTKTFGALSADQWRWFTTLALPVTLIPIWGGYPEDSREYQMLVNFLHLVVFLDLATRRSTNPDRRASIMDHMLRYMEGVRTLFPQVMIPPNFHLMFHIPEFLKLFGPVHSWWAYPFERFNGMLQKIPTNHRFSEQVDSLSVVFEIDSILYLSPAQLEKTITRSFIRASNLLSLIQDKLLPPSLERFYGMMMQLLVKQYSGSLDRENNAWGSGDAWTVFPSATKPSQKSHFMNWFTGQDRDSKHYTRQALQIRELTGVPFWDLHECSHLFHRGASYIPITEAERDIWEKGKDSTVQYWRKESEPGVAKPRHLAAGRIVRIISKQALTSPTAADDNILVIVQRYEELSAEEKEEDPFSKWPECGGRLVAHSFHDQLDVVAVGDIVSHLARCTYSNPQGSLMREVIIVWSLDRM